MPSIRVEGDLEVAAALGAKAVKIPREVYGVTRHWAGVLEGRIKAAASGRPGPRTITGNYVGSWNTELHGAGAHVIAEVGTNAPQGRRLEFGYVGVDSLGRHYAQPPYSHVRPQLPAVEMGYVTTLETIASAI